MTNLPGHVPYASPAYHYEQRLQDDSHLRTLAICHYIWGGITALLALIPLVHVGIGIAMINGVFDQSGSNPPPPEFGWFFVVFGVGAILLGETIALLTIISGVRMARRRGRVFSIVVAAINCLSFPFGTLLGVFTIIVLCRDSVRRQYDEAAAARQAPPHPAWTR